MTTASEQITEAVTAWPGVTAGIGDRGEYGFTVGKRQIGHLHGDRAAHFGFPRGVWQELIESGRVVKHPIDKPGWAARRIEGDEDVREVIALLRLNYDRVVERYGVPERESRIRGLHASAPAPLPFAPAVAVRAFVLERSRGNVIVYSSPGLEADAVAGLGGATRRYLNHWHEAKFAPDAVEVPLFVHEGDAAEAEAHMHVRGTFSRRHMLDEDLEVIPIPGHTPGATAYLWDSGEHRILFTGDSLHLYGDEWIAAVLESSDRDAYLQSLELLRELDFDVLVPWVATQGYPYYAITSNGDARRRIDAIADRIRSGADG